MIVFVKNCVIRFYKWKHAAWYCIKVLGSAGALSLAFKSAFRKGSLGGLAVERLPSAQDMNLESGNQVPHPALCMEAASPLSMSLPLSVSLMSK